MEYRLGEHVVQLAQHSPYTSTLLPCCSEPASGRSYHLPPRQRHLHHGARNAQIVADHLTVGGDAVLATDEDELFRALDGDSLRKRGTPDEGVRVELCYLHASSIPRREGACV